VLAQELLDRLYPDGVEHESLVHELIESRLVTYARRYNPSFDAERQTRKASSTIVVPRIGTLATIYTSMFTLESVMPDGRMLARWTLGELRREYEGLGNLIARFSGQPDTALIGDIWT
jgi:hypothetical protein